MGQLSQYIKSSYELDTEFRLNGLNFYMSENKIAAHHEFNPDEEIYPGELKISSLSLNNKEQEEAEIAKDSNVDNTKLNPETETEFKDPDPDEPVKKTDNGFDERKKNKNQPL